MVAERLQLFKVAVLAVVQEDLADHGISAGRCIPGPKMITRSDIAEIFDQHDQIWHW